MAISNVKNPVGGGSPAAGAIGGQQAPGESAKAQGAQGAQAAKAAAAGYAKSAAAPTVRDAAAVQISPRAKEMSLARAVVDQTPDIREDKVAKFKKAIESGEYKADAGRIADGILGEAIRDDLARQAEVALD